MRSYSLYIEYIISQGYQVFFTLENISINNHNLNLVKNAKCLKSYYLIKEHG